MATKLLLLNDVDNLGQKGQIVNVKPGYAFNYLLPKGLAMVATAATERKQKKLQEERRIIADQERKEAEEISARLLDEVLTFIVKADAEGKLFGSVSVLDIVNQIKEKTDIDIDKRWVQLKHGFKETGAYDVTLRLKEGVTSQIHVKVVSEEVQPTE